ncbi:MAG: MBL fold metallo-hydrolase [Nocardioidaceae bacterium]
MRLTVLGGRGVWPGVEQACSGYVVEHDGFRLFVDPGYATLPRLLGRMSPGNVDAVLISHGHPDHCADLSPLLRARTLRDSPSPALPVYSLPRAVDAVLALDDPEMLAGSYVLHTPTIGTRFEIGPFDTDTRLLPHFIPNIGVRLTAGGSTLTYTGDTGPTPDLVDLARDADLFLAEATFARQVPEDYAGYLTSARDAGHMAAQAGVGRLVLTHLWPGTDTESARQAAREGFDGEIRVAGRGLALDMA